MNVEFSSFFNQDLPSPILSLQAIFHMSLSFSVSTSALLSWAEPTLLSESPWQQSLGGPIFTDRGVPKESDFYTFPFWFSIFLYKGSTLILHKGECRFCAHRVVVLTAGFLSPPNQVKARKRDREHIISRSLSWAPVYDGDIHFQKVLPTCLCTAGYNYMHLTSYFDSRVVAVQ